MSAGSEEYFKYARDLVDEMYELFQRHQELEAEYSSAMVHIQNMGWSADYARYVQDGVEGDSVGDSSD